jgi:hypothetical protein
MTAGPGEVPVEPGPPGPRTTIASFDTYAGAQRAVDFLADQGFPVERLAIVGSDLRLVERVTGRLDYGRAALDGIASGAFTGGLFGLILGLFVVDDTAAVALLVYGLLIGAVLGAVFGLVGYGLTRGTRDFTSTSGMEAGRYDVVADDIVAEDARRRLAELDGGQAPVPGPAPG